MLIVLFTFLLLLSLGSLLAAGYRLPDTFVMTGTFIGARRSTSGLFTARTNRHPDPEIRGPLQRARVAPADNDT